MPVNTRTIVCFDFETGGLDVPTLEPLSIAAVAIDPRSLRVKDEFSSLMRPVDRNNVDPQALKINGLDLEECCRAPEQGLVWGEFARFVKRHNPGKGHFTAPIPAGQNVRKFDLPIADRLCRTHGQVDKDGFPNLFNRMDLLDLKEILWWWFESDDELPSYSMKQIRPYFGITEDGAHTAEVDAKQTADLIIRFLRLHRKLKGMRKPDGTPTIEFRGCCKV